jgi:E3 ubiquitin-protein ligase TRIP12
VFADLDQK